MDAGSGDFKEKTPPEKISSKRSGKRSAKAGEQVGICRGVDFFPRPALPAGLLAADLEHRRR
jgi:hypothetical protein